ncbi:MAG TPA: DUF1800 domain-containing protein [Steroidobacteraceae bacterium]|nr:DUF1800 domain-containing protein [Steroidobacteraceae bacterium]
MVQVDTSFAFFVLGRAGFGASRASLRELQAGGYPAWVEDQLAPRQALDSVAEERLRAARLRIKYPAGEGWAAVDEARPLATLDAPISTLWHLVDHKNPMHAAERRRPRDEVLAATVLRAVHSRWQLREVSAGFWHDHFNVDAAGSEAIGVALPAYDRDVIRRHCFGNFREMLEAVAKSAAMQYYLSNRSSRAGSANENYARELFELHTMGRGAYLNDRYDRWREVPGALKGKPAGYIDQDVYEAARAFTGWTIEDGGSIDARRKMPQTGQFVYVENWHDGYQKRILATEFDAFAPALADGRGVLDLVAEHPATAHFLCDKLCRRFIGDGASAQVRERMAQVWLAHTESHDQIARVLRTLLLSRDFAAAPAGAKTRRPLGLAAAFARAMEIDLTYAEQLGGEIAGAGQNLFGWPTPTGLPDTGVPFLTSQAMRHRWSMLLGLAENSWGTGVLASPEALGLTSPTTRTAAEALAKRLLGYAPAAAVNAIVAGSGWPADQALGANGPADASHRWARLAAYCAMAPQFQVS